MEPPTSAQATASNRSSGLGTSTAVALPPCPTERSGRSSCAGAATRPITQSVPAAAPGSLSTARPAPTDTGCVPFAVWSHVRARRPRWGCLRQSRHRLAHDASHWHCLTRKAPWQVRRRGAYAHRRLRIEPTIGFGRKAPQGSFSASAIRRRPRSLRRSGACRPSRRSACHHRSVQNPRGCRRRWRWRWCPCC